MSNALLDPPQAGSKPLTEGKQSTGILVALWAFVVIPFLALIAAVPVAWGGWLGWTDVAIAAVCYVTAGLGITVGFHRYRRQQREERHHHKDPEHDHRVPRQRLVQHRLRTVRRDPM